MKMLVTALVLSFSSMAMASTYEDKMMECLDYNHTDKTQEQVMICHNQVKEELLVSIDNQFQFLDCIDYGHRKVTFEKEVSCLKELQ